MREKRFLKSFASAAYESNERRYAARLPNSRSVSQQSPSVADYARDLLRHAQDPGGGQHALDVEVVVRGDAAPDRTPRTPRRYASHCSAICFQRTPAWNTARVITSK